MLKHFLTKSCSDELRKAAAKLTAYDFRKLQDTLEEVTPRNTLLTKGEQ